jgi:hypothetical protein
VFVVVSAIDLQTSAWKLTDFMHGLTLELPTCTPSSDSDLATVPIMPSADVLLMVAVVIVVVVVFAIIDYMTSDSCIAFATSGNCTCQ